MGLMKWYQFLNVWSKFTSIIHKRKNAGSWGPIPVPPADPGTSVDPRRRLSPLWQPLVYTLTVLFCPTYRSIFVLSYSNSSTGLFHAIKIATFFRPSSEEARETHLNSWHQSVYWIAMQNTSREVHTMRNIIPDTLRTKLNYAHTLASAGFSAQTKGEWKREKTSE
jgi:hypothetical protein